LKIESCSPWVNREVESVAGLSALVKHPQGMGEVKKHPRARSVGVCPGRGDRLPLGVFCPSPPCSWLLGLGFGRSKTGKWKGRYSILSFFFESSH